MCKLVNVQNEVDLGSGITMTSLQVKPCSWGIQLPLFAIMML